MVMLMLAGALVAFLFYYYIIKPFEYWKERGVKQGKPLWIFGDSWGPALRIHSFGEMAQMIYKQCPGARYSGFYQFFVPTLLLKDPDLIKLITVRDFEHFTDHRDVIPPDADPLWNKNLNSLGQKWREMRTILTPSFTSSKMKAVFVLMKECAENFVQHFLKKDEDVITIEMKDAFTRLTNDVIATIAFGVTVDSLQNPTNEFYLMGKEATNISTFPKTLKFFSYLMIPSINKLISITLYSKEVGAFFGDIIDRTIRVREERGILRRDMIHLLLQARNGKQENEEQNEESGSPQNAQIVTTTTPHQITNQDITAQALSFFFAGFESVAGLMCFLAHELAVNPEIQERLRKEVHEASEEGGKELNQDVLTKMKYMEMVVSEALRKWPSFVSTDRVCTKPYTIEPKLPGEKPVHLKKGDSLSIPIYAIHHDPEHYPDPERFDPERFNEENKKKHKPIRLFSIWFGSP
ncbi:hypothetical protein NQ317_001066 [Molorchus minor]|uniref:Cytochrome P450 n=1 Tax=Molorchus minor TaxID=1323400 RepID=A0ABQ9IQV1_9CUCU|nr:hypothetical protein NQ317_001066 [Molorchus minor]